MISNRHNENDIILRTIKQFAVVLAAILRKNMAGQVMEAQQELEQMYDSMQDPLCPTFWERPALQNPRIW